MSRIILAIVISLFAVSVYAKCKNTEISTGDKLSVKVVGTLAGVKGTHQCTKSKVTKTQPFNINWFETRCRVKSTTVYISGALHYAKSCKVLKPNGLKWFAEGTPYPMYGGRHSERQDTTRVKFKFGKVVIQRK